jgi:hypothetical protein
LWGTVSSSANEPDAVTASGAVVGDAVVASGVGGKVGIGGVVVGDAVVGNEVGGKVDIGGAVVAWNTLEEMLTDGAKVGTVEGDRVVDVVDGGAVTGIGLTVATVVGDDVAGTVDLASTSGLSKLLFAEVTVSLPLEDASLFNTTAKATTAPTTASDNITPTMNRRCRRCRVMVIRPRETTSRLLLLEGCNELRAISCPSSTSSSSRLPMLGSMSMVLLMVELVRTSTM